jgi:hypothetical protein
MSSADIDETSAQRVDAGDGVRRALSRRYQHKFSKNDAADSNPAFLCSNGYEAPRTKWLLSNLLDRVMQVTPTYLRRRANFCT